MRFVAILPAACLLLLGAPVTAADLTPIQQADIPLTINSPGHYYLAGDISFPIDGAAVTVATSDVTIDLREHTITGPGIDSHSTAFAIAAPPDVALGNLTIHSGAISSGTIRDFPAGGIHLPQATSVTISNLLLHDIAGIAIDVGDEAVINGNTLRDIRINDPTRTSTLVGIRAGLNSTIDANTISSMHHAGNGQIDAIRVERGCYVIRNEIRTMTTGDSGTGDLIAIACATMAADIRANSITDITNQRPGGIAIGIRIGSGSAEGNRVRNVAAASLPIGIQGIAAVFIERNSVDGVRAINRGPDAYGIWAAGTGGRVTGNTVRGVDCVGDDPRNREVALRVNSAFEVTGNTLHLPHVRTAARQAGIEISGQFNVIVENTIRLGQPGDPPGTVILLGPMTRSNTIGGNDAPGRTVDNGTDNRVPATPEGVPTI